MMHKFQPKPGKEKLIWFLGKRFCSSTDGTVSLDLISEVDYNKITIKWDEISKKNL